MRNWRFRTKLSSSSSSSSPTYPTLFASTTAGLTLFFLTTTTHNPHSTVVRAFPSPNLPSSTTLTRSLPSRLTAASTPPFSSLRSPPSSASASSSSSSVRSASKDGNNQRQTNPFTSLVGDMASALFSNGPAAGNESVRRELSNIQQLCSWEEVTSELKTKQTEEERVFRTNVKKGVGVASPLNTIRLYDESLWKEEDVRVTFYRDSASWCPYCHKVWLCLEEKRIPYRVEKVNMSCYGSKPNSFLRLQPNGQIPVATIDGTVYNQSDDIIFALEREFPDHKKLIPTEPDQRSKMQSLMRLERKLFSAWLTWLTGYGGERAKNAFRSVLNEVEAELNASPGGDFFMGEEVTLVDMLFAPFLERTVASLLFFKGFKIRVPPGEASEYPAVNRWFDAMERLESYQLTKSDYYTHCWDLPPQLGGCTYEDGGAPYEKAINGVSRIGKNGDGGSWEYPLEPHNGGVEPDWEWCGDEAAARREAAERITFNHEAVVGFATRGAGRKGIPAYTAALSDPNAVGNEGVAEAVDACLRLLSLSLLSEEGLAGEGGGMEDLARMVVKEGGEEYADAVVKSLAYLRDRVGVPRDMRLPAARQLRAKLNWAIEKILVRMEPS